MTEPTTFSVALANETATAQLMADLALLVGPGDVITLSGDLGAGKTAAARAMIRYLAGDETLEVPSPTFTLVQGLRAAALSGDACRPLPHRRRDRARGDRPVAAAGRHARPDRMAGARAIGDAARPHRHRAEPPAGAGIECARRRHHRLRQGRRASRAAEGAAGIPRTPATWMQRASAWRATPRPAPMRG